MEDVRRETVDGWDIPDQTESQDLCLALCILAKTWFDPMNRSLTTVVLVRILCTLLCT